MTPLREWWRYEWPEWRRAHWPDLCLVTGAALLVWALTGYEPSVVPSNRFMRVTPGGYSAFERTTAAVGTGMIVVGGVVKLKRRR